MITRGVRHSGIALVLTSALLGTEGCGEVTAPAARVTGPAGPTINEASAEPHEGAKARIAVAAFVVKTPRAKDAVGDGLADMLATALFQSNRYVVLERQALPVVFAEQQLGATGLVRPETVAIRGQIEGAELLVVGAVTEFEPGTSGAKATLGASIGGTSDALTGGKDRRGGEAIGGLIDSLVGAVKTSHVAIDLRIVDARTARLVAATSVEGRASDIELGGLGRLGGSGLTGGLSAYARTPMEKALRLAIQEATRFIVSRTPVEYYRHRESDATARPAPAADLLRNAAIGDALRQPAVVPAASHSGTVPASPAFVDPAPPAVQAGNLLYVKAAQANVRTEPSTSAKILTTVKRTTRLSVLESRRDWHRVRLDTGGEGWVAASVTSPQAP